MGQSDSDERYRVHELHHGHFVLWHSLFLFFSPDPTKFFGCELGAQTQFDFKNDRYIVNGSHDASKLQQLLDGFIKKFVLCQECSNPETILVSMSCMLQNMTEEFRVVRNDFEEYVHAVKIQVYIIYWICSLNNRKLNRYYIYATWILTHLRNFSLL